MSVSLIIYPVSDLAEAKRQFTLVMGGEPYADQPYYVGYRNGDFEVGLDPMGHKYGAGATPYWSVKDIDAELKQLLDAGAELMQDVKEVAPGLKIAIVKVQGGSLVGLRQMG